MGWGTLRKTIFSKNSLFANYCIPFWFTLYTVSHLFWNKGCNFEEYLIFCVWELVFDFLYCTQSPIMSHSEWLSSEVITAVLSALQLTGLLIKKRLLVIGSYSSLTTIKRTSEGINNKEMPFFLNHIIRSRKVWTPGFCWKILKSEFAEFEVFMTIAWADINRTMMDYHAVCPLQFCSIQRLLKNNWANLNNKLMTLMIFTVILLPCHMLWFSDNRHLFCHHKLFWVC